MDGVAYISFSHHVPGLESDDLQFFELAGARGLVTVATRYFQAPHMWSDKEVDIYIYELAHRS